MLLALEGNVSDNPRKSQDHYLEEYLDRDEIGVCTHLIDVLTDAVEGWRTAADHVGDDGVADMMRATARRREEMAIELSNIVSGRSGDVKETSTTAKGKILTLWLELRTLTARDKRAAVLSVCRRGSAAAIREYDDSLEATLDDPVRNVLVRQANELRSTAAWLASLG